MRKLAKAWLLTVYAFLYLPIFIVIIYSFNSARYSTEWKGFTFQWYEVLINNSSLLNAAFNSLSVATIAASLATILGIMAALALHRYKFFGQKILYGSIYILTVSPDIVMGISLLIFFIALNLELGFSTLLMAHTTLCLPFVTITVLARMAEFDESLVEAARDLGATEWQSFYHVILPLIMPSVLAGWLLAFTLAMDDVLISFFVTGATYEVLPLKIYSMVRLGMKPDINALSTVTFVLTVLVVFTAWWFINAFKNTSTSSKKHKH